MWLALQSGRPDLPWHFGIIEAPTVNAFATPGGNVFVTRGLVERCANQDELAGVLAHEIAHVVQKHQLRDIQKNAKKGMMLDSRRSRAAASPATGRASRVGLEGCAGLSREDELGRSDRRRDRARAGTEPYGLASVLQTLQSMG
jgi:predicted Zn-dependent protease